MRALVLTLVLMLACGAAALADTGSTTDTNGATTTSTNGCVTPTCPTKTNAVCSGEEVADGCIADSLGLTRDQVQQLRAKGLSYADMTAAQKIACASGTPLMDVVAAWCGCNQNWVSVAAKYNVSMSDIVGWTPSGGMDTDTFNAMYISRYFGVPQSQVTQLHTDGFSWDQAYLIANAAMRTGQTVQQIACLRGQGMAWSDIAMKYKVSLNDLTCPTPCVVATSRPAAGAGPVQVAPTVIYGLNGNILLTADQACCLYAEGNDWLDVAIAANMARETGWPLRWFLQRVRAGRMWWEMIYDFNVSPYVAFCICGYPFPQKSVYAQDIEAGRLQKIQRYQKSGEACPVSAYQSMVGRMYIHKVGAY